MIAPTAPGTLGQVSLLTRDVAGDTQRFRDAAGAERFYRDVLCPAHLFTFGDPAFFEDPDGNVLALMFRVPMAAG